MRAGAGPMLRRVLLKRGFSRTTDLVLKLKCLADERTVAEFTSARVCRGRCAGTAEHRRARTALHSPTGENQPVTEESWNRESLGRG